MTEVIEKPDWLTLQAQMAQGKNPAMTWVQRGNKYASYPYQIYQDVRGFSAWIFSKDQSGLLGKEVMSLDKAKGLCEKHKEGVSATTAA